MCAFAVILAPAGALRILLQASVRYRAVPGARASTGAAPVTADCRLGPPCGSSAPNWPFSAGVASADDSYPRKNGEPDRAETSAETKERVVGKLISSNNGGFQT